MREDEPEKASKVKPHESVCSKVHSESAVVDMLVNVPAVELSALSSAMICVGIRLMDHKSATPSALLVEISTSPVVSSSALWFTNTVCAMVHTAVLDGKNPLATSWPVVRLDAMPTYDHPVQSSLPLLPVVEVELMYCR